MDRIEQVVVAIEEALNFADLGDLAHLRLSLLLLESASETLMQREVAAKLVWSGQYRRLSEVMLAHSGREGDLDDEGRGVLRELKKGLLSNRRQRQIEREFDAKVDYLVEIDRMDMSHGRALKKLHDYRNEIYHRDRVREDTLSAAVAIYAYLACILLSDLKPLAILWVIPLPPALARYADADTAMSAAFDLPRIVATALLDRVAVRLGSLPERLAEYAASRVADIRSMLNEGLEYLNHPWPAGEGPIDPPLLVARVQVEDSRLAEFGTREELLALSLPVTPQTIDDWETQARRIAWRGDDLGAFTAFADFEDAVEPFETKVEEMMMEIDRAIQREIDDARGK